MGMADDLALMRMLRNYQLPQQPLGYQPLQLPAGPPPPLLPYQQRLQQAMPFAPEIPALMNPEQGGSPQQMRGAVFNRGPNRGEFEAGGRLNWPF